jgi:hypothetical protein
LLKPQIHTATGTDAEGVTYEPIPAVYTYINPPNKVNCSVFVPQKDVDSVPGLATQTVPSVTTEPTDTQGELATITAVGVVPQLISLKKDFCR